MSEHPRHEDPLEPDAFLRAALRHASDHDTAPPPGLSRSILEAARRATQGRAVDAPPRRWRAALAQRLRSLLHQPGATAALASLMLGTVIGLMWRDGPPPDATLDRDIAAPSPRGDVAALPAPAGAAAAPTKSVTAPTLPTAPTPPAVPARPAPASPAAAPATPAAKAAPRTSAVKASADEVRSRHAVTVAPSTEVERRAAEPAQVPADDAPPLAAARAPGPRAAADAGLALGRSADAAGRVDAASAQQGAALARERAAPALRDAPLAADDPLGPVLAALHAGPENDAQRSERSAAGSMAGSVVPQRDAALAWWVELRRLTHGGWQRVEAPIGPRGLPITAADGGALGSVALTEDAVLWQAVGSAGPAWRAPLPAPTLARLRAAMALWAPSPANVAP